MGVFRKFTLIRFVFLLTDTIFTEIKCLIATSRIETTFATHFSPSEEFRIRVYEFNNITTYHTSETTRLNELKKYFRYFSMVLSLRTKSMTKYLSSVSVAKLLVAKVRARVWIQCKYCTSTKSGLLSLGCQVCLLPWPTTRPCSLFGNYQFYRICCASTWAALAAFLMQIASFIIFIIIIFKTIKKIGFVHCTALYSPD